MSVTLEVVEHDEGYKVEDPLDILWWNDHVTYDSPEDCTCHRNLAPWIAEVNRLRVMLDERGVEL